MAVLKRKSKKATKKVVKKTAVKKYKKGGKTKPLHDAAITR